MKSGNYPYKVTAVYPDDATVETAARVLENANLGDVRIVRLEPGTNNEVDPGIEPDTEASRDALLRDTATGGAAGTAAGAAVAGATAVTAPTLFVSAPIVGPLIVLGYGALIGGTVGAIRGLKLRENVLAALVKDSLKAGYHVIVIHAADRDAQRRAQEVVGDSVVETTAHN